MSHPSRRVSWTAAVRDFKADRAIRAEVREERIRTTLHSANPLTMSAWRGRSGRRYVVIVHPVGTTDLGEGVVIAVRRDSDGVAELLAIGSAPAEATEIHIHRLAETPRARAAVAADLAA